VASAAHKNSEKLLELLGVSWAKVYQQLYERRVNNWKETLSPTREASFRAAANGDLSGAIEKLDVVISSQLQGGLSGGLAPLRVMMANDLCLRAEIRMSPRNACKEHSEQVPPTCCNCNAEGSFQDYCLAALVDLSNKTARENAQRMVVERNRALLADPSYDFDRHYDEEILHGSLTQRARFLYEYAYWRPDKCAVYLHMYLLCDMLKMWPARLIHTAKRCAGSAFQSSMCDAWRMFDMKREEEALNLAQKSVGMLPSVDPQDPETATALKRDVAFAYFTLGFVAQYSDVAVQAYHRFLEFGPHSARLAVTYNNLGSIYCHRGEYGTALEWLNRAKDSNPRSFITYKTMAKCLSKQGERAAAYQVLTTALTSCSPVSADMYSERSKYTWLVTPDLNEATKINPRMSYPYRFRAALYMEAAMQDKALSELQKAIDLTYDPFDLSLLAAFKLDLTDVTGAVGDMRTALLLDYNNASYRTWLQRHDPDAKLYFTQ
jgi:tetratricopeptide (TPR) repeat protein